MPHCFPSSCRICGFLKRVTHGAKKVIKRKDQEPTSHMSSSLPQRSAVDSPLLPTPSYELALAIHSQPSAASQQPAVLSQLAPRPGQSMSTTSIPLDDADQSANTKSGLAQVTKRAGADAWAGLRSTLQLLEKSSGLFPTLKFALADFLEVFSTFETAAQNRKDYAELAANLQNIVREFVEGPGEHTSSRMSEALKTMTSGLEKEMKYMQEQQQRSGIRRYVEAGQDLIDVQRCYRRVEALCYELQGKVLIDISSNQEEQKVDTRLKELNAALKAMFDSGLSDGVGRRGCTPGTREATLAEMRRWADDPKGPKVYWLNGMAGTGKTTLAYSFCAEMQLARRLGASFFCSRTDADSRSISKIVPTIAYQLARLLPSYREVLIRQVGEDKDVGARNIKSQFEKLIQDPLLRIKVDVPAGIVVTIDALDECDWRDGARDILNVLLLGAKDLPIKFLVTCRPEPGLFDVLQSKGEGRRTTLHLHDIEATCVRADIKRYLEIELAETSLSPEELGMLAEQAGTLFIYAATAVRYIHPQNRQVNAHQRLDDLLSIKCNPRINKHKAIDELYTAVLATLFADEDLNLQERENIRLVLDTAICAREPMSITTMTKLLGLGGEQDAIHALQHLRSVLHISQSTYLISPLHASFPDFMLDRKRSKDLCCDAVGHNRLLALCCFSVMERLLKFNICGLESSFILDENILDLAERIDNAVSPVLLYACHYWGAHLVYVETLDKVCSVLDEFLSTRLLFWMEVLNLRGCIGAGAQMMTYVHAWLQKLGGMGNACELSLDASRFVTTFSLSSASRSTPHIYVSALPFWPETRPVRRRYWKHIQGSIRLEGPGKEGRDLSCLAGWNTGSTAPCLASSPDGTRIVSSSTDHSICVWDAYSGDLVAGPFEGHTESVYSVAFSHDGARVVSGSWDKTIRVWDAYSGLLVAGPFVGHANSVYSVAFSLDGTRVVSGSADRTVRVWDAYSGLLVAGPFEGHTSSVRAVAFSSGGTRIVSGSSDNSIRVWDAQSGSLMVGPFERHTHWVESVSFSFDCARIVSGSWDKTICVWDANSGSLVAGPFVGHTGPVYSVAFSPDGTRIISGSGDGTIHIWPTTPPHRNPGHMKNWQMDDTGMITTQQGQLLLCVPVSVVRPQSTVCIYTEGALNLDFDNVLLGNEWMKCYQLL